MQSNQITKQVTLSAGRISGNNKLTVELKDERVIMKEKASRTVDGGGASMALWERRDPPPGFWAISRSTSEQSGSRLLPKLRRRPAPKDPSHLARPDNRDNQAAHR